MYPLRVKKRDPRQRTWIAGWHINTYKFKNAEIIVLMAHLSVIQEKYSDMSVHLGTRTIRAHRFVLAARSDNWGVSSLADVDALGKENCLSGKDK